ncbi:YncE family protein [Pseudomonas nunensis]|uniref:YncE family protein n=1 Tax=Pseudomonas nunensis TaxID=2961896 RepID=UPI0006B67012|nr:YncE family protein [Pseudomonas nunensis]
MATEQPNAEILVNYPPMILGATQPVFPDPAVPPGEPVVGLPLYMFRLVLNEQGVLAGAVKVAVDPPPRDGTGADKISIELILNGDSLENRPIPDAERDDRTEFDLFQASLRDGSNNKVEYKVHRYGGNVGDSIPLWVLYSAHLPGGNDVPGNDDHPYLQMSLPPELGNPAFIGKDDIDQGVKLRITYPFCKKYDKCTVEMRRQRFDIALPPPGPDCMYEVTLTREMFEQSGGSHPAFPFSYTIVDELNNATYKFRWSAIITADVDMDVVTVPAPILREVLADGSDEPTKIDRQLLQGRPLLAVVVPSAPKFEAGDTVEGSYSATTSGATHPLTGTIKDDGFGRFDLCITEIPNDKVVLHDNVEAEYSLFRAGVKVGKSSVAKALVIDSTNPITLNPPTLVPPATSPINVLDYDAGVTVRVTFAGNTGDKAQLKELNPPPGAVPLPVQDIIDGQSDFNLSQAFLAARQDSVIELTWELIRGGVPAGESTPLRLSVNRMIDYDPRLPTPTIPPANNDPTLDLSSFTGDTAAQVTAWRGIAIGQPLWLSCEGTNSIGTPVTLPIHRGAPIGSVGDQSGVVTRDFLDQLADGSQIKVLAAVNFNGVANEATAVKFPVRTYIVRAAPAAKLAFTNGPYKVAPMGRVKDIHLLLTAINGSPITHATIVLTLPAGASYADGGTGARDFITDTSGTCSISGVKGSQEPGAYTLTATNENVSATTSLSVNIHGPVGTIEVGKATYNLAISPDGTRVLVSGNNPNLMAIDTATNIATTVSGLTGDGVFNPDGNTYYISGKNISAVRAETDSLIKVVDSKASAGPVAITSPGNILVAASTFHPNITVIDTTTNSVIKTINIGHSVYDISINPGGTFIHANAWVTDHMELIAYDIHGNFAARRMTVIAHNHVLSPEGTHIYVQSDSRTIMEIDANTYSITRRLPFNQGNQFMMIISPNKSLLYAATGFDIVAISRETLKIEKHITVNNYPSHMVITPDGRRGYVAIPSNKSVLAISLD